LPVRKLSLVAVWKTNGKVDGTARSKGKKKKKKDELGGSPTFQVKYDSGLN